ADRHSDAKREDRHSDRDPDAQRGEDSDADRDADEKREDRHADGHQDSGVTVAPATRWACALRAHRRATRRIGPRSLAWPLAPPPLPRREGLSAQAVAFATGAERVQTRAGDSSRRDRGKGTRSLRRAPKWDGSLPGLDREDLDFGAGGLDALAGLGAQEGVRELRLVGVDRFLRLRVPRAEDRGRALLPAPDVFEPDAGADPHLRGVDARRVERARARQLVGEGGDPRGEVFVALAGGVVLEVLREVAVLLGDAHRLGVGRKLDLL